jgi:hypothetical protein
MHLPLYPPILSSVPVFPSPLTLRIKVISILTTFHLYPPVFLSFLSLLHRIGQNHIYIWCIYGISGRDFTKNTVICGANKQFWPTLLLHYTFPPLTLHIEVISTASTFHFTHPFHPVFLLFLSLLHYTLKL